MDTVPTVHSEMEESGRQLSAECLGLPTILRRILEQFSNKELIDLSLVNKLWNFEARSVLRDGDCLRANIFSRHPCLQLVDFASDLKRMRVIPFSGVHVAINHIPGETAACESAPFGSLDPSFQLILDRLPWKHLSVKFCDKWQDFKYCSALLLVKKILEDYCGVLEEVSLLLVDFSSESTQYFLTIFQGCSFPRLKALQVGCFCGAALQSAFAKVLVSSAPNLEKLHWSQPIKFQENVMEGSSAVLVVDSFGPLHDDVCESLIGAPRTEEISVHAWRGFDVERLNRFVPMVLEASRTTLKTLTMDLLFAVPLMCYGICFADVKDLVIMMDDTIEGTTPPHIFALAKAFDFRRVFPNLKKVEISDSQVQGRPIISEEIAAFAERGHALLREGSPDRAISIKHMDICELYLEDSTLQFLTQMFPHVKTLSVETEACPEFSFTLLWEHFECLEALHVHYFEKDDMPNLDSVFCGIFPEEVAELRAKDDEYLKAVNIVSVMPSITCMKGLRSFTLRYEINPSTERHSTRIFSKVTGLIGFPRCPDLSVKFQISSYIPNVLDHMRPYVPVVIEDLVEM